MKLVVLLILVLLVPAYSFAQYRYAIVIDEIMADPTPQFGLPNNEWIELRNCSNAEINLQNWRLADATGQSSAFPAYLLQPDSFVIVCGSSAVTALASFGHLIGVAGFPSLDNNGELLVLKSSTGAVIHAVNYTVDWFGNELKREGGWTLEMIDPKNPCSGGSNWTASIHPAGGTPGRQNSVTASNRDATAPNLMRAFAVDDHHLILQFNEPLDSIAASILSNYTIDGNISIVDVQPASPMLQEMQLTTGDPLQPGIIYTVAAANIGDCSGNVMVSSQRVRTGLSTDPAPGEWTINEILFDPRPAGYDFVEMLNNSNKLFDASRLFVAGRNASGALSTPRPLSATPRLIFPGEYIVATEDVNSLLLNYFVPYPEQVLTVTQMPSLPDANGTAVALNAQGVVTDEVAYDKNWHFALIAEPEGVSLERIDPAGPSQDRGNWHSAASGVGYATPGYRNSQYQSIPPAEATVEVLPRVFSPDNDGFEDFAVITYSMKSQGYVANVTVFDVGGRPVRSIAKNELLSLAGNWTWNGLNDMGQKLPAGYYVVYTEIFNLQGRKQRFKKVVVIARK